MDHHNLIFSFCTKVTLYIRGYFCSKRVFLLNKSKPETLAIILKHILIYVNIANLVFLILSGQLI